MFRQDKRISQQNTCVLRTRNFMCTNGQILLNSNGTQICLYSIPYAYCKNFVQLDAESKPTSSFAFQIYVGSFSYSVIYIKCCDFHAFSYTYWKPHESSSECRRPMKNITQRAVAVLVICTCFLVIGTCIIATFRRDTRKRSEDQEWALYGGSRKRSFRHCQLVQVSLKMILGCSRITVQMIKGNTLLKQLLVILKYLHFLFMFQFPLVALKAYIQQCQSQEH